MIYDAIVVGGGPAGGTSALLLARAGWSVAVVEKAAFPRRKVCGEFISATTLPLLDRLGLADTFLASAGPPVKRVGLFAGDANLSAPMPETLSGPEPWGRALGREHLDQILLNAAVSAGARVWQPLKTEAPPHRRSDLLGFKAHFKGSALPNDLMPMLVFPGGYAGMVTTDGGRVTLSCCVRRDRLRISRERAFGPPAAEAVLQHIMTSCLSVREVLAPARLDGPWLAAGPIRPGIRRQAEDGLFFVGNIAGEAHPIIAEGISMAMQSAWLLCRRLVTAGPDATRGSAGVEVGRAYTAEWRSAFAQRLYASMVFAKFLMRPRAGAVIVPLVRRFPGLLTFGARLAGKAEALPV